MSKIDKKLLEEAKNGNSDAKFKVGALYHRKWLNVKENDTKKAKEYLDNAAEYLQIEKDILEGAENGDSDAQFEVGALYHRQSKDAKEYLYTAVYYYEKAADEGYTGPKTAEDQYDLGLIFLQATLAAEADAAKEADKWSNAESKTWFSWRKKVVRGRAVRSWNKKIDELLRMYEQAMNYFIAVLVINEEEEANEETKIDLDAKLMIVYIMNHLSEEGVDEQRYIKWYARDRYRDKVDVDERHLTAKTDIIEMKKLFTNNKEKVDKLVKELRDAVSSGGKRTIQKRKKTSLGTRKKNKNKNKNQNKNFSRRNSHGRKKRNKRRTRKTKY